MIKFRHKKTGRVIFLSEILNIVATGGERAEYGICSTKESNPFSSSIRRIDPLNYEIYRYKAIDIPTSPDFEQVKEIELTKRDLVDVLNYLPSCRVKDKVHRIVWEFAGREERR